MEMKEMTVEQLEERKSAIVAELDNEGADLDALENEVRAIKAELESRANEEAKKVEIRKTVAETQAPVVVEKVEEEKREMKTNAEVRASKEYVDAFARYLVSENDAEVRSLLTENVSGSVPVPVICGRAFSNSLYLSSSSLVFSSSVSKAFIASFCAS